MRQFMAEGRIIRFRRRAGRRSDEGFTGRKLDAVRRRPVESAGSAVVDLRSDRGDEGLGLLDRRQGDDRRIDRWRLIAVHLLGGEDRRGAGEQAGFSLGVTRRGTAQNKDAEMFSRKVLAAYQAANVRALGFKVWPRYKLAGSLRCRVQLYDFFGFIRFILQDDAI